MRVLEERFMVGFRVLRRYVGLLERGALLVKLSDGQIAESQELGLPVNSRSLTRLHSIQPPGNDADLHAYAA